jgi:hypothetical protein
MKQLPRGGWFSRGFGFFGRRGGWFGWGIGLGNLYTFCRRFPWLPGWWLTGIYRPTTHFTWQPTLPKEQEITVLENQKRLIEEELSQINKRLAELKKRGDKLG